MDKKIHFMGDSLKSLKEFPKEVTREIGFQLSKLQRGELPSNFKPMKTVGQGVEELRVQDESGWYRAIYYAKAAEGIYVLHCFKKKTNQTSQQDIDIAKNRLKYIK